MPKKLMLDIVARNLSRSVSDSESKIFRLQVRLFEVFHTFDHYLKLGFMLPCVMKIWRALAML